MQTCAVSQGTGTVANGNVTSVAITCVTKTFAVGGTVTGLVGNGLVLQDNLGDNLTVADNGTFTFGTQVASGSRTPSPSSPRRRRPAQTCAIAGASGLVADAAVTNVAITCTTNSYTVGGMVVGLTGSGMTLGTTAAPTCPSRRPARSRSRRRS